MSDAVVESPGVEPDAGVAPFAGAAAEGPFGFKPDRNRPIEPHFDGFGRLTPEQARAVLDVRDGRRPRCVLRLAGESVLVEHAGQGYCDPATGVAWGYRVRRVGHDGPAAPPPPAEAAVPPGRVPAAVRRRRRGAAAGRRPVVAVAAAEAGGGDRGRPPTGPAPSCRHPTADPDDAAGRVGRPLDGPRPLAPGGRPGRPGRAGGPGPRADPLGRRRPARAPSAWPCWR